MSWFSAITDKLDVGAIAKDLTEKVQEKVGEVQNQVQNKLPVLDQDMIQKLTLTSPELLAERQTIDEEERRKEQVRDSLAGMLPWETTDPEREILVDECKEAILALSHRKETFFGPYAMTVALPIQKTKMNNNTGINDDHPNDGNDKVETAAGGSKGGGEAAVEALEKDHQQQQETESKIQNTTNESPSEKEPQPSKESLEKLAKLEPLPPLLAEFDLDCHVGLIQRLLEEDPKLIDMQSSLSGGGLREKLFWRNYFFHCAFTRYEAGLSIDEIWSDQAQKTQQQQQQQSEITTEGENNIVPTTTAAIIGTNDGTAAASGGGENEETTIMFEPSPADSTAESSLLVDAFKATELDAGGAATTEINNTSQEIVGGTLPSVDNSSAGADFEFVGNSDTGSDGLLALGGEMDELEAEIAEALED